MLREAAPWIDRERERRWYFGLHFNVLAALCHLGRYEEAGAGLPELRALRGKTEQKLDPLRLRWLEGRVAGGLGQIAEGIEALSAVRAGFAVEKIRYSEALVSLDLAGLYLQQGRTAEVKWLAVSKGASDESTFVAAGHRRPAGRRRPFRAYRCFRGPEGKARHRLGRTPPVVLGSCRAALVQGSGGGLRR